MPQKLDELKEKIKKAKEVAVRPRGYFQRPQVADRTDTPASVDWSGSAWSGERWSGRNSGGARGR